MEKLIALFISKKRIIGWGAAVVFALGATALGMSTQEFKDSVCGAPVIAPVEKSEK